MAQALEKGIYLQSWEKWFFRTKKVIFSQNSVFDEIQFSQKSLINRKNQPHTLAQQVLVQLTPIIFCCYYKPPRSLRRQGLTWPKWKPNIRPFKRAIDRSSGTRSCGDIDDWTFFGRFFENFKKRPGQLGLRTSKELEFGNFDHILLTDSVALKKTCRPNQRGTERFRAPWDAKTARMKRPRTEKVWKRTRIRQLHELLLWPALSIACCYQLLQLL